MWGRQPSGLAVLPFDTLPQVGQRRLIIVRGDALDRAPSCDMPMPIATKMSRSMAGVGLGRRYVSVTPDLELTCDVTTGLSRLSTSWLTFSTRRPTNWSRALAKSLARASRAGAVWACVSTKSRANAKPSRRASRLSVDTERPVRREASRPRRRRQVLDLRRMSATASPNHLADPCGRIVTRS